MTHPVQTTLKELPFTAKLVLASLTVRNRRAAGKLNVTFGDLLEEASRICMSAVNIPEAKILMKGVSTPRALETAASELEICKVIDWEEKGGRRGGKVALQVSEDELTMAFKQDKAWIEMTR